MQVLVVVVPVALVLIASRPPDIPVHNSLDSSAPQISQVVNVIMTPEFLRSSYKQYKADSDVVATWLANTARRYGYPRDLLAQRDLTQKQPRLKGRARKLARDAQKKSSTSTANNSTTIESSERYILAMKEFVPLAEWIHKSTRSIAPVPAGIVTTLNRTIAARKQHHRMWDNKDYDLEENKDLKQENESHAYFVGVLERVRDILRPQMAPEVVGEAPTRPKQDVLVGINNRFEALNVFEPAPWSPTLPVDTTLKAEKTQCPRFTVEQEPALDELVFALDCFFHDLNNIRRYLQQIWDGYRQGILELVAVSLVTNTAIEFVRGIEEDFVQTFPEHTDFETHMEFICFRDFHGRGGVPNHEESEQVYSHLVTCLADEKSFFLTYMFLSSFSDMVRPNSIPALNPRAYTTYDAKSDRNLKSAEEKAYEDKQVLLQVLPEFCLLATMSDLLPVEDEMTRGMRLIIEKKPVTMWMTFAAQAFLDINHVLRDSTVRGLRELHKSAKCIEGSITEVLELHRNFRAGTWPASQDKALVDLCNMVRDCISDDILQRERKRVYGSTSVPSPGPFFLLQQHPLLCGLLCFNIKGLAQEIGNCFINSRGGILTMAHLYNAIRQERLLAHTWKDMDLALAMHRTEDMFVGSFPTTIDDYFKRFALAAGFSAVNFASDRRSRRGIVGSKAGPRRLNDLFPVSAMFRPRFDKDDNSAKFSPDDVKMILQNHAEVDDIDDLFADKSGGRKKTQLDVVVNSTSAQMNEHKDAIGKIHKRQKKMKSQTSIKDGVRPIQLLNALMNELQSETIELTFDHFRLHVTCWRLLRAVQEAVLGDLERYYRVEHLRKANEIHLPFVIGNIFMAATRTKQLTRAWLPKKENIATRRLLEKAAKVVEAMIKRGDGQIVCNSLEECLDTEVEVPDMIADMLR